MKKLNCKVKCINSSYLGFTPNKIYYIHDSIMWDDRFRKINLYPIDDFETFNKLINGDFELIEYIKPLSRRVIII